MHNHEQQTLQDHPEYAQMDITKDVIVFVINGNHGSADQFPLIWHSLEAFFSNIHEQQKRESYDEVMKRIFGREDLHERVGNKKTVHINPRVFGFEMNM
jgi:hypothetical protein